MDKLYSQKLEQRVFDTLSDSEWQVYFQILKRLVQSSTNTYCGSHYNHKSGDIYQQDYCTFIDSVLRSLRSGNVDYCFHIYQIVDLLNYEKDRLQTQWLPKHKCFKVYLHTI